MESVPDFISIMDDGPPRLRRMLSLSMFRSDLLVTNVWRQGVTSRRGEESGAARVVGWSSHERRIAYRSSRAGGLWIATFYHPAWEARLDGERLPVKAVPGSGLLLAEVPSGAHEVVFRFAGTGARLAGSAISGATALGLIGWLVVRARRRRNAV